MNLTTKRLILRDLKLSDNKDIQNNVNNLKISKYLLVVPYPYSLKDAEWFIKDTIRKSKRKKRVSYQLGVEYKNNKGIIGVIGLTSIDNLNGTAKIGYWLGEKHWRNGVMSEAVSEIINFAFKKLRLRKISVDAFIHNKASNGLLKKLGFKKEGVLRKHYLCKATNKIQDANLYGLLKSEWRK